jgi:hypothetical protein
MCSYRIWGNANTKFVIGGAANAEPYVLNRRKCGEGDLRLGTD